MSESPEPGANSEQTRVPPKPKPPLPGECCGRGCVPCVYDYYHKALEKWQAEVKVLQAEVKVLKE